MKLTYLIIASFALLIAACGDGSDQQQVKESGQAALQKTKEFYSRAKQEASEMGATISEKSKELYDSTVQTSKKAYEHTKQKAADTGQAVVEKSKQLYESDKEKANK